MALPGADVRRLDRFGIVPTTLEETPHYRLYRAFILYPESTVGAMIE